VAAASEADRRAYNLSVAVIAAVGVAALVGLVLFCWWRQRRWRLDEEIDLEKKPPSSANEDDGGEEQEEDLPPEYEQVVCLHCSPPTFTAYVCVQGDEEENIAGMRNDDDLNVISSSSVHTYV